MSEPFQQQDKEPESLEPYRVTFDPPLRCGGREFRELTFDFDSLDDAEFQQARLTFKRLFKPQTRPMTEDFAGDMYLRVILAQIANDGEGNSGVPIQLLRTLPDQYYAPLSAKLVEDCREAIDAFLTKVERI